MDYTRRVMNLGVERECVNFCSQRGATPTVGALGDETSSFYVRRSNEAEGKRGRVKKA